MKTHYPTTGHLAENADDKRRNPTDAEKNFIGFCERMGIQYEFQVPVYCGGRGYILDFELTYEYSTKKSVKKARYVVEIDGDYHDLPEQRKKDVERTMDLIDAGYKRVIRIKNEETWTNYNIFNALYGQIPKEGKVGALYAAYLKEKYNKMVERKPEPVIPIKQDQSKDTAKILEMAYNSMTINKLQREIEQLKKENETLKQIIETMTGEIRTAEDKRDYWKEKATILDSHLWTLSAATGNLSYYNDERRIEELSY